MSVSTSKALPEGWEWMELFQLVDIIAGQAPPSSSYNQENDGLPFLRVNSFGEKYPKTNFWTNKPLKICKKGDILLSVAGTIGDVNIADNNYAITRSIFAIRAKNNSLNLNYLFYYLKILKEKLQYASSGSSQKIITIKTVTKLKIPLPSLETQRRIVSILEKAEETRRLRAQADVLTDRLLKNMFLEMFGDTVRNPKGWEVKGLGAICSEIYRYPTFYGFEYLKNGVPVVRINNIFSNGSLDPDVSNYVFIEPSLNKNFPRTILEFNDIVMAVRGDGSTAKRIGLVNTINLVGANISPNLIRFKVNTVILNPLYLFNLMTSYSGQKLLEKYVTRTAKKTITAKDIKEIPIPLPPLPLQQKFARIVEKIESLRKNQNNSKQHIEDLFNTMMQKASKGELMV